MATDTARIDLELASGRNEITAPFHRTARHRNRRVDELPIAAGAIELPASVRVVVAVPADEAPNAPPIQAGITTSSRIGRPTWIAFIGATVAVAAAVWWVMFQRLPDIDPREIIQRNLVDAQSAMAEGRYTDPPEHSAFHYYSTVLALDPHSVDAIAGIDAIADRHLTDARVMLAEARVAEAAVAIERARRVRPHHSSLPALDIQLRAELKKILSAANAALQVEPVKTKVAKAPAVAPATTDAPAPSTTTPPATRVATLPALLSLTSDIKEHKTPSLITPAPADTNESGSAPVVEESANTSAATAPLPESAPAPVPSVSPKLIKMVQPEYPQEAVMRGLEGWVDVSLEVSATGDVVAPRVEDSSRGRVFNRAALSAVQQWKYEPRVGDSSERLHVRLQFRLTR